LLLRLVYLCLAIFDLGSAGSEWNPLTGSMAALVCMALIPEFVTVMVYLWVGFTIDAKGIAEALTDGLTEGNTRKNGGEGEIAQQCSSWNST